MFSPRMLAKRAAAVGGNRQKSASYSFRCSAVSSLGVLALAVVMVVPLGAQTATQSARGSTWTVPRTADGVPDLEGIWSNATITPFERPAVFGDNRSDGDQRISPLEVPGGTGEKWTNIFKAGPTLTDAQAEEFEKPNLSNLNADERKAKTAAIDRDEAYNTLFIDQGDKLVRLDGVARTSLIVDPESGHVPPLTPEAAKKSAGRSEYGGGSYASIKDRPLSERCIIGFGSTSGPPMLPVLYNSNHRIIQTRQTIMIMAEMIHDVRYIHMDRTEHLPKDVRLWLGDSIGHWEGDTLVIDTTNFTEKTRFRGSSPNLHVIERLTPTAKGTILYKATMDDPTTWTRQWSIEYPFHETADPIYEYACPEGNYSMTDIMGGASKAERDAATGKQ